MKRPWCTGGRGGKSTLVLLLASYVTTLVESSPVHFEAWKQKFDRTYANEAEHLERYSHWLKQYERIERHNTEGRQHAYKLGLNEFSDWLPEEHKKRLGFKLPFGWGDDDALYYRPKIYHGEKGDPPASIDWRIADGNPAQIIGVTSIKNQAMCGACWSFSSVAAIEGSVAAAQGILNELSNEQMIDCVTANNGCNGGDPQYALQYVMKTPLASKGYYPYVAQLGQPSECKADELEPASKIQNYLMVKPCDDTVLMHAVAESPVVIAIDAYCDDFMSYAGGIMTFSCSPSDRPDSCKQVLDHAVAVVGYGTDAKTGLDYWIIKNSWGTSWGDRGFAYIQRGVAGYGCGLGCMTYYSFLPSGGVAYVNGTAQYDDDYIHGEATDDADLLVIARDILAGSALCLTMVLLTSCVYSAWCKTKKRRGGGPGRGGAGGGDLVEPLLNGDIVNEEDATPSWPTASNHGNA